MASDPFNRSFSSFILVGVPGLEPFHTYLGILFFCIYVLAMVGNGAVLLVLGLDKTLQAPSHRFLAMLAAIDVVMATSVVPTVLAVLWRGSAEIGITACLAQMFVVHAGTAQESGVLLAMAVDRYVAVCHPLRYHGLLTARVTAGIGVATALRAALAMAPLTALLAARPYCGPAAVQHHYCELMNCTAPGPAAVQHHYCEHMNCTVPGPAAVPHHYCELMNCTAPGPAAVQHHYCEHMNCTMPGPAAVQHHYCELMDCTVPGPAAVPHHYCEHMNCTVPGPAAVPHHYCEHMAVADLACASPGPARLYGLSWSSVTVGADAALIAASYGLILRAVRGQRSCRRALSTCGCHLCVVLLFYVPGLVSIYARQFSGAVAARTQVLLADLYVVLPALLNPLVYSVRSRQIRRALLRMFCPGRVCARGRRPRLSRLSHLREGSPSCIPSECRR